MNTKLLEVLEHPSDGIIAIASLGDDGPHLINTWNSYIILSPKNELLIPAGRMKKTEENLRKSPNIEMTIGSREVMGLSYKGTGFLIKGSARFEYSGEDFELVKKRFSWARAALVITMDSIEQTL